MCGKFEEKNMIEIRAVFILYCIFYSMIRGNNSFSVVLLSRSNCVYFSCISFLIVTRVSIIVEMIVPVMINVLVFLLKSG